MESFCRLLKDRGMKATAQRMAVHRAMLRLGHASADQVAQAIGEEAGEGGPSVTTASVYNILAQLTGIGVYSQRLSANNKMYYDITTAPHVHLYDSVNHEFVDIGEEELVEKVREAFRRRRFRGYHIDEVDIQLICHPTRKKRS